MMTLLRNESYNSSEGRKPTNGNFEHGSVGLRLQSIKVRAIDLETPLRS